MLIESHESNYPYDEWLDVLVYGYAPNEHIISKTGDGALHDSNLFSKDLGDKECVDDA
ncbi:hypothetical protein Scep_001361 [Stephania cephalantha]|uniref:Uncharacterized protein n=1 Tax=Stephania cephalantha TaxID=152367 RepID=A0AAP0LAL3_9MAGN